MAEGLHQEMRDMMMCAVQQAKAQGKPTEMHLQYREPRVAAKKHAFMFECFSWTVCAGWVGRDKVC